MNCLRCGAEVAEGESFCAYCLAEMEKCPVPPDTYVMIPKRSAQRPSVRKTSLSDDEKLRISNSQLKRARIWIAVLLIVIAGLSAFCVWLLLRDQQPAVGQNYSTVSPTASTSGPLPTEK